MITKIYDPKKLLLIGLFLLLSLPDLRAQSCNCTDTLDLSSAGSVFDNDNVPDPLVPGDVLCLTGSRNGSFKFLNIEGDASNSIIIRNMCDEQVDFYSTATDAIKFEYCKYFEFQGNDVVDTSGQPQKGIKVTTEKSYYVKFQFFTTNFKVSGLEIAGKNANGLGEGNGFAAIGIKTDPSQNCDSFKIADHDENWIMRDIHVFNNWIHDVGGEGIYMGFGDWDGKAPHGSCTMVTYPHAIRGVRVYNNLIENVGFDGIQIKNADDDVKVYDNIIKTVGWRQHGAHNEGIFIGQGCVGEVYNNEVYNVPGWGLQFRGLGKFNFYNNLLVNIGFDDGSPVEALFVNGNYSGPFELPEEEDRYIRIVNNTIVKTAGDAVYLKNYILNDSTNDNAKTEVDDIIFMNNIFADVNGAVWSTNEGAEVVDSIRVNNLDTVSVEAISFESYNPCTATYNEGCYQDFIDGSYALTGSSIAVDNGANVPSGYGMEAIDHDLAGNPRDIPYDIGAYEYDNGGGGNSPPVLSSIGNQTIEENDTLTVNISASDADGDSISFSSSNLPSFVAFTDNGDDTGTLTISPGEGDAGTYSGVQITASDGNSGTDSESFTITVNDDDSSSTPGTPLYRVNAGGDVEEGGDVDWERDKQSDPVSYFDSQNSVNYTTGSNTWTGTNNTSAPDNIFGPYRYDNGAGFGERQHWDFNVDNGDYEVRLYFKAISSTSGTNVFDVSIEGVLELDDYDIYATAGGSNIPVEESFTVTVSDGNLDIDFPTIESGISLIHGIEILSTESNEPPALSAISNQTVTVGDTLTVNVSATDPDNDDITLTASNLPSFASFTDNGDDTGTITIAPAQGDEGSYSGIEITAADGNGGEDSVTFAVTVEAEPSVIYRVNAGGELESDTELDWEKDKQNDPVSYFDSNNSVNYTTGSNTWSGTNNTNAPDNIFGPYRYDNGASFGERQHWDFPVSNGSYEVRLYFKAVSTSSGTNVFDVAIEDTVVLDDYDIYVAAGGNNIPVEESFITTVNDGNLDIDFPAINSGKSIIHGIEIYTSTSSQRVGKNIAERSTIKDLDFGNIAYPNPLEDKLFVEIRGLENSYANLYLIDISGKVLKTSKVELQDGSGTKEISVSGMEFSPGIYFLKIQSGDFLEMKKLIKR